MDSYFYHSTVLNLNINKNVMVLRTKKGIFPLLLDPLVLYTSFMSETQRGNDSPILRQN